MRNNTKIGQDNPRRTCNPKRIRYSSKVAVKYEIVRTDVTVLSCRPLIFPFEIPKIPWLSLRFPLAFHPPSAPSTSKLFFRKHTNLCRMRIARRNKQNNRKIIVIYSPLSSDFRRLLKDLPRTFTIKGMEEKERGRSVLETLAGILISQRPNPIPASKRTRIHVSN